MWAKYGPDTLVSEANKKGKPTVTLMGSPESGSRQSPVPSVNVSEITDKLSVMYFFSLL